MHIDLCAGPELSVAATKSYTGELVALHAWVRLAAGESFDAVRDDVAHAAAAAKVVVERSVAVARKPRPSSWTPTGCWSSAAATRWRRRRRPRSSSSRPAPLAASGWSAADAKHGPLGQVVVGTPVFLLAAAEFGRESVLVVAPDVVARGGRVFPVGARINDLEGRTRVRDLFPAVHEALVPMLEIIPLQQLALELALLRGQDPDRPTGLHEGHAHALTSGCVQGTRFGQARGAGLPWRPHRLTRELHASPARRRVRSTEGDPAGPRLPGPRRPPLAEFEALVEPLSDVVAAHLGAGGTEPPRRSRGSWSSAPPLVTAEQLVPLLRLPGSTALASSTGTTARTR